MRLRTGKIWIAANLPITKFRQISLAKTLDTSLTDNREGFPEPSFGYLL